MTEEVWLTGNDPYTLLRFLSGKAHTRKLRLFSVACCDRIRHLFTDERSWNAVEIAERFADGGIENERVVAAVQGAEARLLEVGDPIDSTTPTPAVVVRLAALAALDVCRRDALEAALRVGPRTARAEAFAALVPLEQARPTEGLDVFSATLERAGTRQADWLRDIFGNPFQPVRIDRSRLTATVLALARAIYDEKTFDHMPILADALEEAGCSTEEVLRHCRGPGPHVRGCWAVDLVLGKE